MADFTIQNKKNGIYYRVEVVDNWRVDGTNFPRRSDALIADGFTFLVFNEDNTPLNIFHETNRLTEYWVGAKQKPNTNYRGANFKKRLWPEIRKRISKYLVANELGKLPGEVTDSEIINSNLHLLDAANPDEPNDSESIDDVIRRYTGRAPRRETKIRSGTVVNIDCAYDGQVGSGGANDDDSEDNMQIDSASLDNMRAFARFSLSAIPTGSVINDSDLQVNIIYDIIEAGDTVRIRSYGTAGDDDPESDSGTTRYNKCASGSSLVAAADYNNTGSHTDDLGATADSEIQDNIDSPGYYSIAWVQNNFSGFTDAIRIESLENAGSDPATLTIDYTTPVVPAILSVSPSNIVFEA